jgi:ScaI-like restriction endonuclease
MGGLESGERVGGVVGGRRALARSTSPRAKEASSPYFGVPESGWERVTRDLIENHPLGSDEIVDVALKAWSDIFESSLGSGFRIGKDIFPRAQIMAFFLQDLIALEFERTRPTEWRAERTAADKDLVCIADDRFSVEIKASSHRSRIFANRSYGQPEESAGKKLKSGYYLAVNFDPWPGDLTGPRERQIRPPIRMVRFGWLDHSDWLAQAAATGQAASLPAAVENSQLLTFYKA